MLRLLSLNLFVLPTFPRESNTRGLYRTRWRGLGVGLSVAFPLPVPYPKMAALRSLGLNLAAGAVIGVPAYLWYMRSLKKVGGLRPLHAGPPIPCIPFCPA